MSTLKTTNLQNPSAGSPAIVLASDGTATAQLSSINGGPLAGARNRIINGDMKIDQRNAGASVTVNVASSVFSVDRWFGYGQATDGVFTLQQSTDTPAGFVNSLKATVTTADASIGASQIYLLTQIVEANNIDDLDWGKATAKSATLSFWVKSSLTGTFGGSITNNSNFSYPFSYSISAANTWEYKTVSVTGPTSGTWGTGVNAGLTVRLALGAGSSQVGTAGAWTGSHLFGVTGQVNVIGTLNATFYITGVQLEAGSVATPFERRSYGQELALCQRYYFKNTYWGQGNGDTTNIANVNVTLPVTMRAQPSVTNDADTNGIAANGNLYNLTAASAQIQNGSWWGHHGYVSITTNAQITRWTACSARILNFQASAEL